MSLRFCLLCAFPFFPVAAETIDLTVRRAPYNVGGASSKSEKAWCPCKFCGAKTSYERTYKWDYDNHVWIETTKAGNVPDVCRKCRPQVKEQEKLDRKECKLDQQIECQRTRIRIKDKERELRELRKEAR